MPDELQRETDHLAEFCDFMRAAHYGIVPTDKPDYDDCAWEDYKIERHSREDVEHG